MAQRRGADSNGCGGKHLKLVLALGLPVVALVLAISAWVHSGAASALATHQKAQATAAAVSEARLRSLEQDRASLVAATDNLRRELERARQDVRQAMADLKREIDRLQLRPPPAADN